ncbi:hypothetical protein [Amylibacter marinus]|uniref:hypothetical protein n=1 Tax=Amylibacter marinus TaxID=1475483 RepID=UPI0024E06CAA|nr:hypothetical protein [Amylibacter marinus]
MADAIAGTLDINLTCDPMGQNDNGKDVFLRDIWGRAIWRGIIARIWWVWVLLHLNSLRGIRAILLA